MVAITGASGAIYGIRTLQEARKNDVETHLIVTRWGQTTIEQETPYSLADVKDLAHHCYGEKDLAAPVASGSFGCDGMIISPCSMKTLSAIASGYSESLVSRAADVMIKEGKKLVVIPRETPLSPIHLENMLKLARIGVVIMPPAPAFYTNPKDVDEIVGQTAARALQQFGLTIESLKRWGS